MGGVVSPQLERIAAKSLKTMFHLGVSIGGSFYPGTLPIGSGNEDNNWDQLHFYPDRAAEILMETTGPIALESETVEAS